MAPPPAERGYARGIHDDDPLKISILRVVRSSKKPLMSAQKAAVACGAGCAGMPRVGLAPRHTRATRRPRCSGCARESRRRTLGAGDELACAPRVRGTRKTHTATQTPARTREEAGRVDEEQLAHGLGVVRRVDLGRALHVRARGGARQRQRRAAEIQHRRERRDRAPRRRAALHELAVHARLVRPRVVRDQPVNVREQEHDVHVHVAGALDVDGAAGLVGARQVRLGVVRQDLVLQAAQQVVGRLGGEARHRGAAPPRDRRGQQLERLLDVELARAETPAAAGGAGGAEGGGRSSQCGRSVRCATRPSRDVTILAPPPPPAAARTRGTRPARTGSACSPRPRARRAS